MQSLKEIAQELGVSTSTLQKWIKRENIIAVRKHNRKTLSDEDFQKARAALVPRKQSRDEMNELKSKGLRKCKICKTIDAQNNFRPDENLCLDCYKTKMNNYYKDNKDSLLDKQKLYYQNNKEQFKRTNKRWHLANQDKVKLARDKSNKKNTHMKRFYHVKWKFGLRKDEYEQMIEKCDGKCNICHENMKTICVDHDHSNGKVRDILCRDCNYALGDLNDHIPLFYKCIEYLLYSHLKECYKHKYNYSSKIYRNKNFYLSLFDAPDKCEICERSRKEAVLHIDHDHDNNRIRGLLCSYCNHALGHFKDNVTNIGNAIIYLEKHAHSAGSIASSYM
jgi:DNA-binding transcriptional MerR regulator